GEITASFQKSFSPEAILVQNGNYSIAQVTRVAEVDASIHGRRITLPDRPVLAAIVKLDEERAGFEIEFLRIVVKIFFLIAHPFFNIRLIVSIKFQAVRKHLEPDN